MKVHLTLLFLVRTLCAEGVHFLAGAYQGLKVQSRLVEQLDGEG